MQRRLLAALMLGALALTFASGSRAQSTLDAGLAALDAGIVAPGADAGLRAAAGALPVDPTVAQPVSPEVPIDVGAGGERALDVTVRSKPKEAQRLQRSAEAVTVVELKQARQRSSDMGEVLARTQGVTLRRSGGLGSTFRFCLNGLCDDQIRFFLDGVPLEVAGYPFGIANMPMNLVDRVEIFRGVLPVRFGSDALGGSVNLATEDTLETGADASYQVGSFGTHRVTARARYLHEPSGFTAIVNGFFDDADNDYEVDVEVPDKAGQLSPARVKRKHDHYRAYGASAEVGFTDRRWAKRLMLRGYVTGYDKELQNNVVMSVPYGEVNYGELVGGTTLRYFQPLTERLSLDLLGGYVRNRIDFVDKARWVYDWYGRRVNPRRVPGEIESDATDQTSWQDTGLARAVLTWQWSPQHVLRAASTSQLDSRTGDERIQVDPNQRDPLTAERKLLRVVSGIEYELNAVAMRGGPSSKGEGRDFEYGLGPGGRRDADGADGSDPYTGFRLQNILFAKNYVYRAKSEEPLPGNVFRKHDNTFLGVGAGDSLRYTFTKWLLVKGSYEYAIRTPRADEAFGDGVLISPNLQIEPERSHNVNLGPRLNLTRTVVGSLMVDVNGFLRDTDKQIVLLGNDRRFTWQNVYRARTLGFDASATWISPGRYVNADASLTWLEQRNASTKGTFGAFEGDRIPNRPYLMASWGGGLRFARLLHDGDALEPFYTGRYVHSFYRGWESQGLKQFKQVVPTQTSHGLGVTYTLATDFTTTSATLEVQNLTEARLFDNFGVQRPGRAFFFKIAGQI